MNARRTKADIEAIREAIDEVVAADFPMTVRQVFYQLVSMGVIAKTEAEYKGTVIRLLGEMRESGDIPWSFIVDNTRWMRKPRTFDSAEDAVRNTARFYRQSLWSASSEYVEVWLEKEALAGVLMDVTAEWDVPLMVTRGYPSKSYLYSAAETIAARGADSTTIYYYGDLDPSGVDIPRAAEAALRRYIAKIDPAMKDMEFRFIRAGVTREQVIDLGLQTRPTKKTDTRATKFTGESVELDAIPSRLLRLMVEARILDHVDEHQLRILKVAEDSERSFLGRLADSLAEAGR